MSKKILDSDISRAINLRTIAKLDKFIGIIWCICATLFLELLLNDEPFAIESRLFLHYMIGLIPFYMMFQDKKFLMKMLAQNKYIWIMPYVLSALILFSELYVREIMLNTNFGFPPLVRECPCVFFWIMSIPLTIIEVRKIWVLYASTVMLNSILYYIFLETANEVIIISNGFVFFNVLIISVCSIFSIFVTKYYVKVTISKGGVR